MTEFSTPLRRLRLWMAVLPLVAIAIATATTGFAASVPVASGKVTSYRTCTLTATPSTTTVETDANVQQASPNTNYGTLAALWVTSNILLNRRTYVRFDLTKCSPVVPSGTTVKLATLRMYVSNTPNACRTHDIFRVPASWSESTLTWNNQPFGTSTNNPAASSRTDSLTLGSSPCQNTVNSSYVSGWNVTADLQAFVAGTATNYGWMIRDDAEDSVVSRASTYEPKDQANVARPPQLVITY
jgi:hypothetical protein